MSRSGCCVKKMANNCRCAKVYGLLGMAAKKGSLVSGSEACERALNKGVKGLLVLAGDSAEGTKAKFRKLAGISSGVHEDGAPGENADDNAGASASVDIRGEIAYENASAGVSAGVNADVLVFGVGVELGRRIGKGDRSVMMVTDINMARGICALFGIADGILNGGVEFGKNQGL